MTTGAQLARRSSAVASAPPEPPRRTSRDREPCYCVFLTSNATSAKKASRTGCATHLWERLLELEGSLAVTWRHVRGHRPKKDTSDDARYNREVDALAREARLAYLRRSQG